MASLAFQLATFGCNEPWLLILFLAVGTLPPLMELLARQRDLPLEPLRWLHSRSFAIHMALFIFLLATGYAVVQAGRPIIGGAMLLTAILIRCGTVPVHTWVSILFESGRYGTAILFIAPLVGVYAAVRLVLPTADLFVLRGLGAFSLLTAIASAGLAVVQPPIHGVCSPMLLLSYSTLILIGLEIRSEVGLTGAFALWVSVSLSLTGLGLVYKLSKPDSEG
jgi:NADH-quinone oxidoreductase subunit M